MGAGRTPPPTAAASRLAPGCGVQSRALSDRLRSSCGAAMRDEEGAACARARSPGVRGVHRRVRGQPRDRRAVESCAEETRGGAPPSARMSFDVLGAISSWAAEEYPPRRHAEEDPRVVAEKLREQLHALTSGVRGVVENVQGISTSDDGGDAAALVGYLRECIADLQDVISEREREMQRSDGALLRRTTQIRRAGVTGLPPRPAVARRGVAARRGAKARATGCCAAASDTSPSPDEGGADAEAFGLTYQAAALRGASVGRRGGSDAAST